MSGYAFHPDAFADLDEIWEYIAQDNVEAADRVLRGHPSDPHDARGIASDWTSAPGSDDPPVTISCRAR